ncbi:MAG TPA: hypothetical protein PK858_05925, partial [Saprospiraceae bacterium]|nr:hypothetical protein [Saprospiraceae bacterium]
MNRLYKSLSFVVPMLLVLATGDTALSQNLLTTNWSSTAACADCDGLGGTNWAYGCNRGGYDPPPNIPVTGYQFAQGNFSSNCMT